LIHKELSRETDRPRQQSRKQVGNTNLVAKPRRLGRFNPLSPPILSSRPLSRFVHNQWKIFQVLGGTSPSPNYACRTVPWTPQGAPLQIPAATSHPHCKTSGLATDYDGKLRLNNNCFSLFFGKSAEMVLKW